MIAGMISSGSPKTVRLLRVQIPQLFPLSCSGRGKNGGESFLGLGHLGPVYKELIPSGLTSWPWLGLHNVFGFL